MLKLSPMGEEATHGVPKDVLFPEVEQIVQSEKLAWSQFLGRDIEVPQPPDQLMQTQAKLRELGISGFEPHYFPKMTIEGENDFPNWKFKPGKRFWKQVRYRQQSERLLETLKRGEGTHYEEIIENSREFARLKGKQHTTEEMGEKLGKARGEWIKETEREVRWRKPNKTLTGTWVLIDGRQIPNYQDGQQMYGDDYLAPIIGREQDRIERHNKSRPNRTPHGSRFAPGIGSTGFLEASFILEEFAKVIGVDMEQVRLPTAIEFNVLGNMHHPEWREATCYELVKDGLEDGGAIVPSLYSSDAFGDRLEEPTMTMGADGIGFRPIVVFPS